MNPGAQPDRDVITSTCDHTTIGIHFINIHYAAKKERKKEKKKKEKKERKEEKRLKKKRKKRKTQEGKYSYAAGLGHSREKI